MSKRVTLLLDDKIMAELRQIQGHDIIFQNGNVSFSTVVNAVLIDGLKVRKRRK